MSRDKTAGISGVNEQLNGDNTSLYDQYWLLNGDNTKR